MRLQMNVLAICAVLLSSCLSIAAGAAEAESQPAPAPELHTAIIGETITQGMGCNTFDIDCGHRVGRALYRKMQAVCGQAQISQFVSRGSDKSSCDQADGGVVYYFMTFTCGNENP